MLILRYAGLKRSDIPAVWGVYAFRDSAGIYIYVGIAKNLRFRLWSHIKHTGGALPLYNHMRGSADLNQWTIDTYNSHDCMDRTQMTEYWAVRTMEKRLISRHCPPCNTRSTHDENAWVLCEALSTVGGMHKLSVITCEDRSCYLCNHGYGHNLAWTRRQRDGTIVITDDLPGAFVGWVIDPQKLIDPTVADPHRAKSQA